MSFEEPNDPRSNVIANNQIQLTELATYEERTPSQWQIKNTWILKIQLQVTKLVTELTGPLTQGKIFKLWQRGWSTELVEDVIVPLFLRLQKYIDVLNMEKRRGCE